MSSKYVLGVNLPLHDSAAALLRNGELVAMAEGERLSRKRWAVAEPPGDAIVACLAEEGISLDEVDEVAVGWDIPALLENEGHPYTEGQFRDWLVGDRKELRKELPPLRFVDHHLAHAASAFHTSGFAEAAIVVADGRGEDVGTTIAAGGPHGIEIIETWGANQSLGFLYGAAADWAGLTEQGAGKLMGLAAYGTASQSVPLTATDDGYTIAGAPPPGLAVSRQFRLLEAELRDSFRAHNFPFREGNPGEVMAHADFAASVQDALEGVLFNLAAKARRECGHEKLVMAGGVALNCAANGALIRSGIFEEVWIPPFPHDAGASVGAALIADRACRSRVARRLPHAFWGPALRKPDADTLARLEGCETGHHDDGQLAEVVAQALEEGKLVGWCQGRAEVGQRALGARSILCDPRRREALLHTNMVKGREAWRPLAPAVLAGRADEIFQGELPAAADFMLAAWPVREQARARLPAAVHVDGSARPQIVRPVHALYHEVVDAFRNRTELPALINTSFNLAGEPIVLSASDAVSTFLRSDLDVLVLGNLVVRKSDLRGQR